MITNYIADKFEAYPFIENATGVYPLHRLNAHLQGVELYIKRDDVMDVGLGGNKLRKLEYLVQHAIETGADTLITSGGIQSNHARLTAIVAAKAGLHCELVLSQAVENDAAVYQHNGNILLEKLLEVPTYIVPKGSSTADFIEQRVTALKQLGRKAYVVPMGGSSAIGCLGYVNCFLELAAQSKALGKQFSAIAVANGSAGTHAGLLAGKIYSRDNTTQIVSYAVLADENTAIANTLTKTQATLALLDPTLGVTAADVCVNGNFLGSAYGQPTVEMWDALKIMAKTEGIFLDPVYSGKAFAGLLADIKKGMYPVGSQILFMHTGGTPGLFAYENYL